jgi:hypothetical protein
MPSTSTFQAGLLRPPMIPAEGRFFASRSDMLGLIVCRVDVGLAATDGEVRSDLSPENSSRYK